MKTLSVLLFVALVGSAGAGAQDPPKIDEGVHVGVDFVPGVRPGLVVLPGPGVDSIRAIVQRDLEYTDRFEMVTVGDAPPPATNGGRDRLPRPREPPGGLNYPLYRTLGAEFAVELDPVAWRGDRPLARRKRRTRAESTERIDPFADCRGFPTRGAPAGR